jgi:hypothetical protein
MPSRARNLFKENAADIERLLALHQGIGGTLPGRRYGLEVLNKSAIVLITAFWEAYCEDIAAEGLEHIIKHGTSPDPLPKEIKQSIAKDLKDNKNELSVWDLSGDGWKKILKDRLELLKNQRNKKLNTPKTQNIDELFQHSMGLSSVSSSWKWPKMTVVKARAKLDKYVTLRGEIAHRGIAAEAVTKKNVEDYFKFIKVLVSKTDNAVDFHVREITGQRLWRKQLRRRSLT